MLCVTLLTASGTSSVLVVLLAVMLTRAIAPHGSILTSAIVTGYCTFLCFGALGELVGGGAAGVSQLLLRECEDFFSEADEKLRVGRELLRKAGLPEEITFALDCCVRNPSSHDERVIRVCGTPNASRETTRPRVARALFCTLVVFNCPPC